MIDSVYNEGAGVQSIDFDPKKLRYDEHGVPILSPREIEAIADELLQRYCPAVLTGPRMTPVTEILDKLHKRTGLTAVIVDLGHKGTAKVIGRVSFRRKILYLDQSLTNERKAAFRFTAAHEIGHWILHRYNYENWKFSNERHNGEMLEHKDRTVFRLQQRTPRGRLESQAKVFAASIVTPRLTFVPALVETQKQIGITRNTRHSSFAHGGNAGFCFEEIVTRLSRIFEVSKECVRIRIRTLDLLEREIS